MKTTFLLLLFFLPIAIFGDGQSAYSEILEPSNYDLVVDENVYPIEYQVNADVIAMEIDSELTSLLIGLENSKDSVFLIELNHDIISAEKNEYIILVNGYEVDYQIDSDLDSSILKFHIPEFTEEIEIIGTHVIPEFPMGVIMGFLVLTSFIVIIPMIKSSLRL